MQYRLLLRHATEVDRNLLRLFVELAHTGLDRLLKSGLPGIESNDVERRLTDGCGQDIQLVLHGLLVLAVFCRLAANRIMVSLHGAGRGVLGGHDGVGLLGKTRHAAAEAALIL